MNLLLFDDNEINPLGQAQIQGRRARHILNILKAKRGDELRAGVVNGRVGVARLEEIEGERLTLQFCPQEAPPPPLPLKLVLALPRPKALRRLLADATSLGVKEIYLIHAAKVEKAYWHSEHLAESALAKACRLGLEQARDTVLPRVHLERRFKPFVEDHLPSIAKDHRALVAHPGGARMTASAGPQVLVVGPEGGFIPYEIDLLRVAGFQTVSLGERILRTETALTYFLAKAWS